MPLGPHVSAWAALRRELQALLEAAGGDLAAVIDEGNMLWCWSPASKDAQVAAAADRFYKEEVAPLSPALHRGGHLHAAHRDPHWRTWRSYVAESFAGIYVVVLWHDGSRETGALLAHLREAIPRIEPLTVAMPPPDGPGAGEAAGKLRA
jgi:hypothetical protein